MDIKDGRGHDLEEVVLRLSSDEMADLLVATSEVDDGTADHVFLRDASGRTLAIYPDREESQPLERASDWWVGPLLLGVILLLVIGAFSVARSLVGLLF